MCSFTWAYLVLWVTLRERSIYHSKWLLLIHMIPDKVTSMGIRCRLFYSWSDEMRPCASVTLNQLPTSSLVFSTGLIHAPQLLWRYTQTQEANRRPAGEQKILSAARSSMLHPLSLGSKQMSFMFSEPRHTHFYPHCWLGGELCCLCDAYHKIMWWKFLIIKLNNSHSKFIVRSAQPRRLAKMTFYQNVKTDNAT